MTIDVRKEGGVSVYAFEGGLGFGQPLALLEQRFEESIGAGERLFAFDLRGVPWLDSSGLGQVVACHQRVREQEGVVKLVLADRSQELFKITRLEKMFEIFEGLDGALASFAAPDGGYRARH